MSYSCLEELQVDLDLHMLDKTIILSNAGCQCNEGWFVITDDGHCHLFSKDGNLDDIRKVTCLNEEHIRQDIKMIIIPDSVTSIGYSAFRFCSWLTSVTIPDSVTSIEKCAFRYCSGLMSVTIPNSVMSIGSFAFFSCDKLTNLTFKNKTIEQVKKMKYYPWGIEDKSIIQVG